MNKELIKQHIDKRLEKLLPLSVVYFLKKTKLPERLESVFEEIAKESIELVFDKLTLEGKLPKPANPKHKGGLSKYYYQL